MTQGLLTSKALNSVIASASRKNNYVHDSCREIMGRYSVFEWGDQTTGLLSFASGNFDKGKT